MAGRQSSSSPCFPATPTASLLASDSAWWPVSILGTNTVSYRRDKTLLDCDVVGCRRVTVNHSATLLWAEQQRQDARWSSEQANAPRTNSMRTRAVEPK